jgi:hypothetical protein
MIINFDRSDDQFQEQQKNELMQYISQQKPEILASIAQSAPLEVKQAITHNVMGLVGMLPAEGFGCQITTNKENLANLLASAMMTGYFLSQVEKRMDLEEVFGTTDRLDR